MDSETIRKITDLNRQFYQTFAFQFSSTRQRLQPGVKRGLDFVFQAMSSHANLLDLGCGNGELAQELARRGHRGHYVGLDFSIAMLEEARANEIRWRKRTNPGVLPCIFLQADLTEPDWEAFLQQRSDLPKTYECILAFAVLHHLPGFDLRRRVIESIRRRLSLGGRFVHSNWQFMNSERLRKRILPWEAIGLNSNVVDPGDYLLDWRHGGYGLRYVHAFTENELCSLAAESGFIVEESFFSDGKEGNLGLYQVWRLATW